MSDEVKLEPCPTPWCDERGGEPYVLERRFDCLGVYCPTCRVSTPYFTSQQQAIECWNSRHTTAPPCPELVERIAEAIALSDYPDESIKWPQDFSPRECEDYRSNARAAIAAIEAARPTAVTGQLEPQGGGWQPIETAPQDGRRVVVWAKHYNAPCSAEHNGVRGWCVMGMPLGIQPTHWQPLPDPPAQPGPSK